MAHGVFTPAVEIVDVGVDVMSALPRHKLESYRHLIARKNLARFRREDLHRRAIGRLKRFWRRNGGSVPRVRAGGKDRQQSGEHHEW